jgi:hypothetical protein
MKQHSITAIEPPTDPGSIQSCLGSCVDQRPFELGERAFSICHRGPSTENRRFQLRHLVTGAIGRLALQKVRMSRAHVADLVRMCPAPSALRSVMSGENGADRRPRPRQSRQNPTPHRNEASHAETTVTFCTRGTRTPYRIAVALARSEGAAAVPEGQSQRHRETYVQ